MNYLCQPWMTPAELQACPGCPDPDDPVELQRWIDTATQIIYYLSGSMYGGECESTWRPCLPGGWYGTVSVPVLVAGQWFNVNPCTGCGNGLMLPFDYPRSIAEVKIDGAVIPTTEYRLDQWSRSIYLKSPYHWTHGQDLSLADTEVGTFSVTVLHGLDPPAALRQAAIDYAAEVAKACTGAPCALPARATSIVKQGVSIDLGVALEMLDGGRTGLASVDVVLAALNPYAARRRSLFISPDIPATMG